MPMTRTQSELRVMHGTPVNFTRSIRQAVTQGFLTERAAEAAIQAYNKEYEEAEPDAALGVPVDLVNRAAYAVLNHQGVDLRFDASPFYQVEAEVRVTLRAVCFAEMLAMLQKLGRLGAGRTIPALWVDEIDLILNKLEVSDEPKNEKPD